MTATDTKTFHIITMGCSKNRVDSEGMGRVLSARGMAEADRPEDAQVVIVNTCGFLAAARAESVGMIDEMLGGRRDGQVVIAAGCMPALPGHAHEIPPGVDAVITTHEWDRIGDVVAELIELPDIEVAGCQGMLTSFQRIDAGPSAYVKIADGCDHNCHFCAIPLIKGGQVSKRPSEVIREIRELAAGGTKEVVLVAQDTIRYGADLGIKHGLPNLLQMITEEVPELPWLRMLYIYPTPLTLKMVDKLAEHDQLLNYIDMPIQHADKDVLRLMGRPSNVDMTRRLVEHARNTLDEVTMRTTFIVGHPGETEDAFRRLVDFVEEMEFDHVGVFTYSHEPGTKSALLEDTVPPEVAEERRAILMEVQQGISLRKNQRLIGRTLDVLIEGTGEIEDDLGNSEPISVGRARFHAPEVDGLVFIPGELPVGQIVDVTIEDASPYDLWAAPPSRRVARRALQAAQQEARRRRRAHAHSVRPDQAGRLASERARTRQVIPLVPVGE
ncbi:MAG TPA: 30S ribosomal protein S12 methylthiotransferase RimO [Thermomicrobiales bacterium]|nr:30S ribosomal protein S12 methylthiotransferase RimO [Thermomicrobiales bacterium]